MKINQRTVPVIEEVEMIIRIILYILAAVSMWYGYMIYSVHSGSQFYITWFGIGLLLIVIGIAARIGLFAKLPMWLNVSMALAAGLVIILVAVILVIIISYSDDEPKPGLDYIIVLGAQVRPDGPSRTLRYRLEAAEKYLKENPETKCIVSGGKGENEIMSEAEAMKRYLVSAGIDEKRIIMEDRSTTTFENIKFSKEFLPNGARTGIVTNDFHMYRGIYLCKKHGLKGVSPVSAYSEPFYRPNNYLREALAYIKDFLFS